MSSADLGAFQSLYEAFTPHMRRLYDRARVTWDGQRLLRPCSSKHYNGLWHDDFAWPLIGLQELCNEPELASVIPWVTEAMVDLPVVADRIEFDGTAIMSPGWALQPPLSQAMPLHLPSAWVRLLAVADQAGIEIPHKPAWARLIQRSYEQVPFSFGLVLSDTQKEVVGFGFQDQVRLAGLELMSSLVTSRGMARAAELFADHLPEEVLADWRRKSEGVKLSLHRLFDEEIGGFIGASRSGRAFAVWGNGLAWPYATEAQKQVIATTLRDQADHIFVKGCTRQVPDPEGWPGTDREVRYQNGGFWGTGTGFVLPMLAEIDRSWALRLATELLENFEAIQYAEWVDAEGSPYEPLEFLGTVSVPMMALRAIIESKHLIDLM